MVRSFETIINQVVAQPDMKINDLLEIVAEAERQHQKKKEKQLQASNIQKLKMVKRKARKG